MNISLIVPAPFDAVSGGYAYDRRIVAGLRALGHEVGVLEMAGKHPLPDPLALVSATMTLRSPSLGDVVVVDGLALPSFAEHAADLAALGAVGLIHHPTALETGFSEADRTALKERERALFPRMARLITTSRLTAERLPGEFGALAERIGTVEPGTDPAERATGSGGPCAILSVGVLAPRKGHDLLLRALGRLTDVAWTLTIAGSERDVAYAAGLRALAAELGIADRVTFAGEVSDAELDSLYARADLFAAASWWEGYGMAVAEALARGLPLAVTAGGALADLAPKDAAVVVPAGDWQSLSRAMRRPIYDAGLRAALADAAWAAGGRLPRWEDRAAAFARELETARTTGPVPAR